MCLAVPAKVIESNGDEAVVDLQGNRLKISRVLTPDADIGDWVLVHAGFAISQIDEDEAKQTWEYLKEIDAINAEALDDAGGESA